MKHTQICFLLFASALFFFTACKKDKKTMVEIPALATPLNDTMLWVVFDTGSWWIYQSALGLDTVVVTNTEKKNAQYIEGEMGYNYDYYVSTYRNITRNFEYKAYYYRDRAKFACTEPRIQHTGQEFFFANVKIGIEMERNANCCMVEERNLYKQFNGIVYPTVVTLMIYPYCQWNQTLFPTGATYDFNFEVGLLQFEFGSALGWQQGQLYTIKNYHVNHL